ncbi:MAG: BamA/TamA family outer membrane protein [Bacteroidaceae bacterium]|nr:BamA/TamA family outer membrane protein [Bacteroidaceae bacterium]
MKRTYIIMTLLALLTACSTTRYITDGEQLYTGIKKIEFVEADKYAGSNTGKTAIEEVTYALECAPNGSIFGSSRWRALPLGLWWYNAFHNSDSRLGKWFFNTFATDPVLVSDVNPQLRAEVATEVLKYYGYFNGNVTSEILTDKKSPKEAQISYTVTLNEPYKYDSIEYCNFPAQADSIIKATWKRRQLKDGEQFNASAMENERTRLSGLFRNNGYYYYQPGYIKFLADSINNHGNIQIRIQPENNLPARISRIWKFGNTNIRVTKSLATGERNSNMATNDTLGSRHFKYIYNGKKPPVKTGALLRNMQIRPGELYSYEKQQNAFKRLSEMNIFSNINFTLTPRGDSDTLDINITTQLDKPYDFTFELNATAKSNDQIGPGSKISLARKNVFRGGETLKFTLNGSYEWQTDKNVKGRAAVINSWEVGADVSLNFPRLFFPIIHRKYLRMPATTSFRLHTDLMNRSGFFRMIRAGGDATYNIRSHSSTTHTVIPFRLSYDMLLSTTEKFDSIAKHNRSIENSFRNQFIPAMQYTYTYDNTNTYHRNKTCIEASVTSAGNITSLLFYAFGKRLDQKDKNIFGNPYAQFIKGTAEMRQLWKIDKNQYIATRIMAGAIYSYGNSEYAPYSEQFYIGGANSLRAFTIRSIGPGSFRPDNENRYSYLDETGTLKFEMNVEYRFRIISDLHGALFVDAGNIWLMKKDPQRPGGELKASTFAEQIALNTGFGARYDLEFLVLRLDFGLGLHAPYKTKRNGYFNLSPFKEGFAWHFAIGYPF